MEFEEIVSLKLIRLMRHEGTEGQRTVWHTSFSIGIDKANEIGIAYKNHYQSPMGDAILKNGTDLYMCTGTAGTAEVGGKKFIMLEVETDYILIDGQIYVRCHDEFSIDPVDPRDIVETIGSPKPTEDPTKE